MEELTRERKNQKKTNGQNSEEAGLIGKARGGGKKGVKMEKPGKEEET